MANTLFVNFDIRNRFNVSSLSGFALSGSYFTFIPTLQSQVTTLSQKKVLWDFGDGTTSSSLTATHTYEFPGVYPITLYVFGVGGTAYVNSFIPAVSVFDYVPNKLVLNDIECVSFNQLAGKFKGFEITRYNSWQTYPTLSSTGYTLNLYASGTSDPLLDLKQHRQDSWSHLRTLSRFAQLVPAGNSVEYLAVSSVTTEDTLLYARYTATGIEPCDADDQGAIFAGTSGTATIYFASDVPKNFTSQTQPAIIFCSLDTRNFEDQYTYLTRYYQYASSEVGYINTQPVVIPSVKIRNNVASKISFSTNGIDSQGEAVLSSFNIPPVSWQQTRIPFVAKLEDTEGFSTRFYPVLSAVVQNLSTNSVTYNLSVAALVSGASGFTVMPTVSFYADFLPELPGNAGGYFKGYFVSPVSALNVKLSGGAWVQNLSGFEYDSALSFFATNTQLLRSDYREDYTSRLDTLTYTPSTTFALLCATSASGFSITPSLTSSLKSIGVACVTPTSVRIHNLEGSLLAQISQTSTSIAFDGNNHLWLTVAGQPSAFKYSTEGAMITATAGVTTVSSYSAVDVDTDCENSIWVAYNKTGSASYLVKYNTLGAYVTSYSLPSTHTISRIQIDRNNQVFAIARSVAGSATLSARNDSLYAITSAGALAASYPVTGFGFASAANIAFDIYNRVWVINLQNTIKNVSTGQTYTIGVSAGSATDSFLTLLHGDTYGRVGVYNSSNRSLDWITNGAYSSAAVTEIANNRAADLNGFRWIDKYASTRATTAYVSGESNLFNLYPSQGVYHIYKKNENFNMGEFYKSLVLPDHLTYAHDFFDRFLTTIVGGATSQPYELGRTIYEKTANFADNHVDPDVANVRPLLSLCEQYGVTIPDYVAYQYPAQLQRIVDMLSIKHSKLFGNTNKYTSDFYAPGITNAPGYAINLGTQYNITTDTFPISSFVIANEVFSNTFKLVRVANLSGYELTATLPLSGYTHTWGWGLVAPNTVSGTDIGTYYRFYRYTTGAAGIYNSTIDWTASGTTLSFTNSSYTDWVANDGICEQVIGYELTKGLRAFLSASDIVFNN